MSNDEIKSFVETHPQDMFVSALFIPGITNAYRFAIGNGETQMKSYSTCPFFISNILQSNENVAINIE